MDREICPKSFWSELSGTKFLKAIAFSRFAAAQLVDLVEPHLGENPLVLDYGGGDNLYLVRELLRRGYRASCYEPNAPVDYHNADLRSLPNYYGAVPDLHSNAYDCIFLSEVIEHLEDPELDRVLSTIVSALKPNGLLVITTPDNEDLFTASRYCPVCKHLFHPWGHVRAFTAPLLEEMLRRRGLECEVLHSVDFSGMRSMVERAKENAEAMTAAARRISALIDEMRKRYGAEIVE